VRPWLAAVCLNTARQEHRRRLVRPPETLDGEPGIELASPLDTAEQALARVAGDAVRRALWQLPAGQREAIALMDLCGFSAAQAAELMGVARGTVLARVHRGRKRLAVLLEDEVAHERLAALDGGRTRAGGSLSRASQDVVDAPGKPLHVQSDPPVPRLHQ
jgi:DNA-directed RNA polymerase specialized sigma24 family protein